MSGKKVFKQAAWSVVTIQTVTNTDGKTSFTNGSGFFIASQHIVTSSNTLLFRDDLAIRNPPAPIPPGPSYVRVVTVYVTVYNSQCNKDFIYKADIVGIDGAGGVGLLYIDCNNEWNKDLPSLKCQEYLDFIDSKDAKVGQEVFIIANSRNTGIQTIKIGILNNNGWFSQTNDFSPINQIGTDILSGDYFSGAPIVNNCAQVLGFAAGSGFNNGAFGPSSSFITPIIKAFLQGKRSLEVTCNRLDSKTTQLNKNTELISDPAGNYFRYIKGFIGISWRAYNAAIFALFPQTEYKKNQGIIITGTQNTPFGNIFAPLILDASILLTEINNCPIGNGVGQISPTEIIWYLIAGQSITLTYRSSTDNFKSEKKVTAALAAFPDNRDYYGSGVMLSSNKLTTGKEPKDCKDCKEPVLNNNGKIQVVNTTKNTTLSSELNGYM